MLRIMARSSRVGRRLKVIHGSNSPPINDKQTALQFTGIRRLPIVPTPGLPLSITQRCGGP
jgi:hypothetical protein